MFNNRPVNIRDITSVESNFFIGCIHLMDCIALMKCFDHIFDHYNLFSHFFLNLVYHFFLSIMMKIKVIARVALIVRVSIIARVPMIARVSMIKRVTMIYARDGLIPKKWNPVLLLVEIYKISLGHILIRRLKSLQKVVKLFTVCHKKIKIVLIYLA